jgi:hypothetical protein
MPIIDSNTLVLLPMDSDWDDDATPEHTTQAVGSPILAAYSDPWSDTGNSGRFTAGTTYLIVYDISSDFDLGTGDFTVDFWLRAMDDSINSSDQYLMGCSGAAARFDIAVKDAGTAESWGAILDFTISIAGTSYTLMAAHQPKYFGAFGKAWMWNHYAFVRKDGNVMLFLHGSKSMKGEVFPRPMAGSLASVGDLYVMRNQSTSSHYDGWAMKNFRLSNVARWWQEDPGAAAFDPWTELETFSSSSYKIEGTINEAATIEVYNRSTGVLITSSGVGAGSYSIGGLDTSSVDVTAESTVTGASITYGDVTAVAE